MFKFNMSFHNTCPKEGVVCNMLMIFFLFIFFPIKDMGIIWGKQMLHLNCFSQLGKSPLFTTKKAHGIAQNLTCLCKVYKVFALSLFLLAKFKVFIQTFTDEEVVPLSGVALTLSSTRDACR
jgi:hypothetical protein